MVVTDRLRELQMLELIDGGIKGGRVEIHSRRKSYSESVQDAQTPTKDKRRTPSKRLPESPPEEQTSTKKLCQVKRTLNFDEPSTSAS